MATAVTINSRGRITLPKELRDRHHLVEGEEALVVDTEAGILIRPRPKLNPYGLLKGRIGTDKLGVSIRSVRRGTRP